MTAIDAERSGAAGTGRGSGREFAWVKLLDTVAAVCAGAAVVVVGLILQDLFAGATAWPLAFVLLVLAALAAAAGIAARRVQGALFGRIDLFAQALEASNDAQAILAPSGKLAYSNAAYRRLLSETGVAPLEALAARLDGGNPAAREAFERLRVKATSGDRADAELPLRESSGVDWFSASVYPLAGRSGYSFWSFQDITARREMEGVIRDEQNKLVDFLDNAPIGFYSVDNDGRFLFVNQTLAQWLDLSPQEIVGGARLHDFIVDLPAGTPAHEPFGPRAAAAQRGEVVLRGAGGRAVHAYIGQSVVATPDGLRTRSVVRDLTPEREWEESLRRAQERFRRFFDNAPVGVALLDHGGRLEEVNRALGELFDAAPPELLGKKLLDFVRDEDRAEVANKLAAVADGKAPAGSIDVRLRGAKEKTTALFVSRLNAASDGEPGGLLLHFIDVTDQKSLQTQFAQSQKMQAVGQLAGGVAHDFNNLLTAMIGFCDLLLLRFRTGDPSFADIMQIKQNANRAANLVRQLLAFSRQQTLQPRILNITDVLAELSHLLRRLIGENIELKMVHGRDLGLVKVDQGQLEQVIINLAVNARDAMAGGGTLNIRTANVTQTFAAHRGHEVMPPGEYVQIEVADTGVGIPQENLVRIFEPFFSTKEVGSGTGLGLSTVYGIVKQTGGFVFVDSEPGAGATFSIFLPRHQQVEAAAQPKGEGANETARDLTGTGTVLLVEDEDPVRLFSARALRNKGYKVLEAKSGEQALEVIQEGKETIDLVVTDVVMPRMDGPGLIKHLREIHPDMKVIFISGYTEDAFRKRLDHDADIHFLPKPFSLKQLAGKVKEVMSAGAG